MTGADWRRGGRFEEAELKLDVAEEVDLRFRRVSGCWGNGADVVDIAVEI